MSETQLSPSSSATSLMGSLRRAAPWLGFAFLLAFTMLFELSMEAQWAFTHQLTTQIKAGLADPTPLTVLKAAGAALLYVLHTIAKPLAVFGAFFLVEFALLGPPKSWRLAAFALLIQLSLVVVGFGLLPLINAALPERLAFGPLIHIEQANLPYFLAPIAPILLALLTMLIYNIGQYWVHRAQHTIPLLWRFHSVHHSIEEMDALNSYGHPIDLIGDRLGMMIMATLIGCTYDTTLVLLAFFQMHDRFLHTRAPVNLGVLGWVLVDNRYHFMHHSIHEEDYGANYSAHLTFLDHMFGTYRQPYPNGLPPTGVSDKHPPKTVWQFFTGRLDDRSSA